MKYIIKAYEVFDSVYDNDSVRKKREWIKKEVGSCIHHVSCIT